MMKKIKLFIQIIVLFTLSLSYCNGKISNRRLCADENCSTIISTAVTQIKYTAGDKYMLSFQPNKNVNIYSKSAGDNPDVWGVDIGGRRGYVPKKLLLEQKIFKKDDELVFEVDTELITEAVKVEKEVTPTPADPLPLEVTQPKELPSTPALSLPVEVTQPKEVPSTPALSLPEEVMQPKAVPSTPLPEEVTQPKEVAITPPVQLPVEVTQPKEVLPTPAVSLPVKVPVKLPVVQAVEPSVPNTNSATNLLADSKETTLNTLESGPLTSEVSDVQKAATSNEQRDSLAEKSEKVKRETNEELAGENKIEVAAIESIEINENASGSVENTPESVFLNANTDDEKRYKGQTPVNEPKFIEKKAYVTGEHGHDEHSDEHITLEIAASNADIIIKDGSGIIPNLLAKNQTISDAEENSYQSQDLKEPAISPHRVLEKQPVSMTIQQQVFAGGVMASEQSGNPISDIVDPLKNQTKSSVEIADTSGGVVQDSKTVSKTVPLKAENTEEINAKANEVSKEIKDPILPTPETALVPEEPSPEAKVKVPETSNTENAVEKNIPEIKSEIVSTIELADAGTQTDLENVSGKANDTSVPKSSAEVKPQNNENSNPEAINVIADAQVKPPILKAAETEIPKETSNLETTTVSPDVEVPVPVMSNDIGTTPLPPSTVDNNRFFGELQQANDIPKPEEPPFQEENQTVSENLGSTAPEVPLLEDTSIEVNYTEPVLESQEQFKSIEEKDANADSHIHSAKESLLHGHLHSGDVKPHGDHIHSVQDHSHHEHAHPSPNSYFNPSQLANRIKEARSEGASSDSSTEQKTESQPSELKIQDNQETKPSNIEVQNPIFGQASQALPQSEKLPTPHAPIASTSGQTFDIDESLFKEPSADSTNEGVGVPEESWIDNSVASVLNFVNLFNPSGVSDDKQRTAGDKHESNSDKAHHQYSGEEEDGYCEKLTPGSCPKMQSNNRQPSKFATTKNVEATYDDLAKELLVQVVERADIVIFLVVTAATVLMFALGYYCIKNNKRESSLVSKLNILEKKLMTSGKECALLQNDLVDTRGNLASIQDNSFGSNEMVIALKKQLEASEEEKEQLQEQIVTLEKELETAAEAGLEVNNMLSELLSSKNGSETIINTVEELQRQLNEQEETTMSINNLLAEKSRENSELHIQLSEKNGRYETEIEELLKAIDVLKQEKETTETELSDKIRILETELRRDLESKTIDLEKATKENLELKKHYEEIRSRVQMSDARAQALEESINKLKKADGKGSIDFKDLMEATDLRAQLLALSKERETLKDKLDGEVDARHLLEDHMKMVNQEVNTLRQEFNQAEKEKIEAQTRLEVLSVYFKEKETQLQKELSVKEAITMKQQGESTSTVERMKGLQQEIQELKSQNDALRAEIEAQSAAHKAQINAAESRAHEFWLSSKQAERRFEEVRSEATTLRRKLTTIATNNSNGGLENNIQSRPNHIDGLLPHDVNAPSPIHLESPGSPIMNLPLPFLPPPFMGPPPMNMPFLPPPPLLPMPPGEMRPPPLGRLMSPPPPNNHRYSPDSFVDDRQRYGAPHYGPDDRYNDYSDIRSQYETETDFSPPRSPEPRPAYRDHRGGGYRAYSPAKSPPPANRNASSKGSSYSSDDDYIDNNW